MKTFRHFCRYLVQFFLEWEMFYIKVVGKVKTHILCSITLFRKPYRLWDHVEKCGGDWEPKNDVTTWRIHTACWISKATSTYARAHIHTPGYSHARTHRPISNTYCFPTVTMIRRRASMLRYTQIACLVRSTLDKHGTSYQERRPGLETQTVSTRYPTGALPADTDSVIVTGPAVVSAATRCHGAIWTETKVVTLPCVETGTLAKIWK